MSSLPDLPAHDPRLDDDAEIDPFVLDLCPSDEEADDRSFRTHQQESRP